jgi:hypothetical protein
MDRIPHQCTDEDFSFSRMAEKLRNGRLPPGYLEAYGGYMRRTHAPLAAEIETALTKSDPNGKWTF